MNIKELVAQAKAAKPIALASVPEKQAVLLLRETFRALTEEMAAAEPGAILRVAGFGNFHIREVDVNKASLDGSPATRIIFKPLLERPTNEEDIDAADKVTETT